MTASSTPLSKNFEPAPAEAHWNAHWSEKGYFSSTPDDRPPYTVVIPPPNVTGVLHLGHTLNETVQDVLVRKARMSGFNACWVPGSDHASIATEAKVVQLIQNEQGVSKHQIGREKFLEHAFAWKEKYGGIIYEQIRRLGCSVDWNRVTFTMDDHYYAAVIKVFVGMYRDGLLYRGARMIHWDPSAGTALSDEEVEYSDTEGQLYHVRYAVEGTEEYIVIATQRPETIPGDTAVCVHPGDERYAHLRGKSIRVPLTDRTVPLIFDEYVDPAFGTGALKVTPAHDINDYNLGLKHNLPIIDTLNPDGTVSEAAGIFVGADRFEARKLAVAQLREEGLLVKEETYATRVGRSQRTGAVVEPRISTQWFVRMKALADAALDAVNSGAVRIHPEERFIATYRYWLENVKDWCISRQLWWGQRIPAWYDDQGNLFVGENEAEVRKEVTDGRALRQDEDVMDTWFSSWLWPMEVFNGITQPDNPDFQYYYPTSTLVTGQDIIFFWVARMIMAGKAFTGKQPFSDVYFTGMVRDKQGRKMSKQLGNSPDLLELIDRFGADAVRFGILIAAPAGNDLLFDDASCEQGRHFNNKLWNALKLVRMWADAPANAPEAEPAAFAMDWFAARLRQVQVEVEKLYAGFRLSEALKTVYSLVWDDFCSWYLEWVKPPYGSRPHPQTLEATVSYFESLVQLLHPFMPFITEEIFHQLRPGRTEDLTVSQFPGNEAAASERSATLLEGGQRLQVLITALRDARSRAGLKPKDPAVLHLPEAGRFGDITPLLGRQTGMSIVLGGDLPAGAISVVAGGDTIYLSAPQGLDTGAQKEQLQKELEYLQGFLQSVEKKLSNERFVQNAKPEVVEAERKKKSDAETKMEAIRESLSSL